jgi:prefoldin alpha subunit
MSDEEMEKLSYEMQALRARAEEIRRQETQIRAIAEEASATIEAMGGLGKEALFDIGSGALARAAPAGTVLVNVGAGILVEKKPADAKKIVEERRAQAEAALKQIQKAGAETVTRMNELALRAQKLQGETE